MGTTQLIGYHREQINLSNVFKALGHPARVRIINLLLEERLMSHEIAERLPIARPTVVRHLRTLFETNLIGYQSILNRSYYVVNKDTLKFALEFLEHIEQTDRTYTPLHKVYFNKTESEL